MIALDIFSLYCFVFFAAEMHSDSIILRDDFDSYHQQELNPTMWWVSALLYKHLSKWKHVLNEIKYKLKCGFASLGPKYFGLLINSLMSD